MFSYFFFAFAMLIVPISQKLSLGTRSIEPSAHSDVSNDLSFRAVASQVLSALQSLTSVFGMGTGGPFALK